MFALKALYTHLLSFSVLSVDSNPKQPLVLQAPQIRLHRDCKKYKGFWDLTSGPKEHMSFYFASIWLFCQKKQTKLMLAKSFMASTYLARGRADVLWELV